MQHFFATLSVLAQDRLCASSHAAPVTNLLAGAAEVWQTFVMYEKCVQNAILAYNDKWLFKVEIVGPASVPVGDGFYWPISLGSQSATGGQIMMTAMTIISKIM
jgi:hypothetical protein